MLPLTAGVAFSTTHATPSVPHTDQHGVEYFLFIQYRTKVRWIQFTIMSKHSLYKRVEYPLNCLQKILQQPHDRLISECPIRHKRVVNDKSWHFIDLCHLNNNFRARERVEATSDPLNSFTMLIVQQQCNIIRVTVGGHLFLELIIRLASKITAYSENCP